MRIVLIADAYPPMRSSGAVQLRDLSREFALQGHEITILVASPEIDCPFSIEDSQGITVARLRCPKSKDVNYVRRIFAEFAMPFAMLRQYRKSPLSSRNYDAVIWYSPTIFLGPLVRALKEQHDCPSYLILRDIFPQWAADMGLIKRGPIFHLLNFVANYQYRSADAIGVQTPGNLSFFDHLQNRNSKPKLEVLQNWLSDAPDAGCSIDITSTKLAGRRIFVYAGNIGVAQQMDKLIDLAEYMRQRDDVGFLFVGRGSELQRLRQKAENADLNNILFEDEIEPDQIPGLYRQCHAGMISLDNRHQTHNIPGKFLTYMQAGLPVLASINANNDLKALVEENSVGRVSISASGADLPGIAEAMLNDEMIDPDMATRCQHLSRSLFSADAAIKQIISTLSQLTACKTAAGIKATTK